MGNEMGNSNVSGLTEEEKSAVEAPERSLENADDHEDGEVKGENCAVHENFVALSPDDLSKANDTSGAAYSHVQKNASSDEEQDCGEEVPTEDLVSVQSENDKAIESNLEGTNGHQIQKQISIARDPKCNDQNEVVAIQDEQIAEELSVTPRGSELNNLDIINLSLNVISDSSDREVERQIHELSQEDNLLEANNYKEKGEILCVYEDKNDSKEVFSTFSIGLEDEGENKDYLVNSSQQVVESQEKMMIDAGNKEDLCGSNKIMFSELKSEEEFVASQSEIFTAETDSKQENATDFNQIVVDKEEKEDKLETLATELNVETQIIPGKLRKLPSFDFDIPFEARCEESDRTPLLHHDLAKIRSSANTNVEEYVEEKTIRVERSDSDKPRTPFLSLLQKEEETNTILATPQAQEEESHVSIITSSKGSGKRKPIASLFSTCICCETTIH